jgi:hypothetical protein
VPGFARLPSIIHTITHSHAMHVFSDFNKDLTKEFGVLITAKESEHYKVNLF